MIRAIKSFLYKSFILRKSYQLFKRDWLPLLDLSRAVDVIATMRFTRNLEALEGYEPDVERILVIAPHPDDEMIGPGGTLIRAIKRGAKVKVLYLSCGRDFETEKIRAETKKVAIRIGYETVFLGNSSRDISLDEACLESIAEIINEFSPEVLFIPFCLDDHDDHRRASHLLLLLEQNKQLKITFEIWAYQVYSTLFPNVVVDISDVAEEKATAIKMWSSQAENRNWAHYALGLNAFNIRFTANKSCMYAETFMVMRLAQYIEICKQYFKNNVNPCYYVPNYKEALKHD